MRTKLVAAFLVLLAGCATPRAVERSVEPVRVSIIAFNDLHGALEPPRQSITTARADGTQLRIPAGGVAYLASAIASLKAANANHAVVSAGDMIGASPLVSANFLDEPTILAMNLIGIDYNAVGNHEFDRGRGELLRMQNGGCERFTNRTPCGVDADFPGARFTYLAANVATETGATLFPAYGIRTFGEGRRQVKVGFIGLTTRATPTLVSPTGVSGLNFTDEADTINALVPRLRAEGADAIVVLIHEGLATQVGYNDKSCDGVSGDLLPILARLDPEVDLVVSGHTHNAYICDYARIDPTRPILATSAGRNGTLLTNISLSFDPSSHRLLERSADNLIVQGEAYRGSSGEVPTSSAFPIYSADPAVAALVQRYVAAAAPITARVVGRLSAPGLREQTPAGESVLGDLIADAHLAATRAPENGGAQIAFTNGFGVRADIVPAADGSVTFGQLFTVQPFGNNLVVKSLTGRQIRTALEQQFASGSNSVEHPNMLLPSAGFTYSYDLTRPEDQRIIDPRLNGQPLGDDTVYRVAMNAFLSTGGDNFTVFRDGPTVAGGPIDVDALEAYFRAAETLTPPTPNRITRLSN